MIICCISCIQTIYYMKTGVLCMKHLFPSPQSKSVVNTFKIDSSSCKMYFKIHSGYCVFRLFCRYIGPLSNLKLSLSPDLHMGENFSIPFFLLGSWERSHNLLPIYIKVCYGVTLISIAEILVICLYLCTSL